jgi:hypothetical protein
MTRKPRKLTTREEQRDILQAREDGETQCSIARRFGVSEAHVSNIVNRVGIFADNPLLWERRNRRVTLPNRRSEFGSPKMLERFWSRVRKSGGRWEWTACINQDGYGMVRVFGRASKGAHRVSWEMANGPIPHGGHILHRCDNRRCVRPDHLFLGDNAANTADRQAKGRQARGETIWESKLTAKRVVAMRRLREMGVKVRCIGSAFGVDGSVASRATTRKTWKHVQ